MLNTPILSVPTDDNVREWLTEQMKENGLTYLLAFADDGVIWGRIMMDRWSSLMKPVKRKIKAITPSCGTQHFGRHMLSATQWKFVSFAMRWADGKP
jgi:hypothetical protein